MAKTVVTATAWGWTASKLGTEGKYVQVAAGVGTPIPYSVPKTWERAFRKHGKFVIEAETNRE